MLERKRPFVYELGGRLYLIGADICIELHDEECIDLYNQYKEAWRYAEATFYQRFCLSDGRDFQSAVGWDSIPTPHQQRIGAKAKGLETMCSKLMEGHELDAKEHDLRSQLEKDYPSDVKRQFGMWVYASYLKPSSRC